MRTGKNGFIGRDTFALRKSPAVGVTAVALFALGVAALPGDRLGSFLLGHGGVTATNLGNALFRLLGAGILLLLALDLGYGICGVRGRGRGMLLALPFLLVAVNNAPWIGLLTGSVTVQAGAGAYLVFALYCAAVGLAEESAFRGIVLPLLLGAFPKTRKHTLWAVLLSSAIFGAAHLINLLSSPPLAVLAQVGYSFLIGCMCAVTLLLTRSIWACALLHALYDFCGLLADALGSGQVWSAASIALTAAVGAAAAGYGIFLFVKKMRIQEVRLLYDTN
ncbi:MAG: CPBP family intramembrane metalloprotease, partial [Clostridiales bacterium]|nr:CPBP family intramembrane metalloprotease [Clostridiales bacterium]